jgi:hypothetical protein
MRLTSRHSVLFAVARAGLASPFGETSSDSPLCLIFEFE